MLTKSTSSPNKVLSSMNSLDDGSYFVLKRNINTILKSAVVRTSLALTTSSLDCQHTSNIMTTRYDIARWLNYKTLCRKWSLLYLLKVCFIKFTSYCRVLSNSCTTLHDRGGDSGIYCVTSNQVILVSMYVLTALVLALLVSIPCSKPEAVAREGLPTIRSLNCIVSTPGGGWQYSNLPCPKLTN